MQTKTAEPVAKKPAAVAPKGFPKCPGVRRFDPIYYKASTVYYMESGFRVKPCDGSRYTAMAKHGGKYSPTAAWARVCEKLAEYNL